MYRTTKDGEKFKEHSIQFSNNSFSNPDFTFMINEDETNSNSNEVIKGFGGAFTDAMTYNLLNISNNDIINQILYDYFSINGSGYTLGRIPMASCDFSPYSYTWAPVDNDFNLEYTQQKKKK